MPKILEEGSDSDIEIKTNNEYAKNYNTWRKKEELNRLKTKYGDDSLNLVEESTSSSSDDDDEGVELTEKIEKQFFKTLSCLKNKDPRIYDENVNFFEDSDNNVEKTSKKKKKDKPLYVKDYERELVLKRNGELSDSEEEQENPRAGSPTYVEEQEKLKESVKKALNQITEDDDEDCEWGGMLKARQKTEAERIKEEEDYKEWLSGQKEKLDDKETESELKPLKDYWNSPNLDDGEKFLRDYILKKKFLSNEDEDYIPTYEEIVHDSDQDLSEDEEAIDKQEAFEHKYNFRFEEPDQEFIKRYPRTMEHSLRKTDDKRKLKRAETKERKQKEKQQKMQELKKLHEFKRKEIEEKIEKLKEITGNTDIGFKDDDLDGDFDPEAHDKRMQSLFNDEFYRGPEEEQKPEFPDLDEYLELENWEKWKGEENAEQRSDGEQGEHAPHCEDENFNMDCDYDSKAALKEELIENSKGKKKRKRKSLFAKVLNEPKPVFDPNDKTYEEYLDEYYKLDCEDIIGDTPCRFKYRKVVPNSFGLTVEEILSAKDRELNKWCSLKKAIQHRPDDVETYDQMAFAKKAKNIELKKKILPSLFESSEKGATEEENQNQSKKEKNTRKMSGGYRTEEISNNLSIKQEDVKNEEIPINTNQNVEMKTKVKKKKKKKNGATVEVDGDLSKNQEVKASTSQESLESLNVNSEANTKRKKKKKKTQKLIENAKENGIEGHKKKKKAINNDTDGSNNAKVGHERKHSNCSSNDALPKKKIKKNKGNKQNIGISDARLSAYGINPKKFKNKLKYGKK